MDEENVDKQDQNENKGQSIMVKIEREGKIRYQEEAIRFKCSIILEWGWVHTLIKAIRLLGGRCIL